jgi:hypothetical protein
VTGERRGDLVPPQSKAQSSLDTTLDCLVGLQVSVMDGPANLGPISVMHRLPG